MAELNIQVRSPFQKMILDVLWSCDTEQQVMVFRNSLPNDQQRAICDVMIRMLAYEYIDLHTQTEADCALARTVIASVS